MFPVTPRRRRGDAGRALAAAGWALALAVGCSPPADPGPSVPRPEAGDAGSPAPGAAPPVADGVQAPESFDGTAGIVDVRRDGEAPALLRAVRTGSHELFDRIVFEFEGGLPGYHVEYVDRPVRQCGSGETVELAGDAWLEIRLTPAAAHTEEGQPTVGERERRPGLETLLELEATCDFEADVTWVAGVRSPNRYRVLELSDPPRLVVDVKH